MALVTFLPIAPEGGTLQTGKPRNLPFPTAGSFNIAPPSDPLTYYALKLPLDKAVEYWWRVKSWLLTYSIGDLSGLLTIDRGIEQGQEQDICKPDSYVWYGFYEVAPSDNSIAATVEIMAPQDPRYFCSHTEVTPAFRILIQASYFSGDEDITVTTASNMFPFESTVTFDGNVLQCTADKDQAFTFTIEPVEWYSYSGTWGVTTGAKN